MVLLILKKNSVQYMLTLYNTSYIYLHVHLHLHLHVFVAKPDPDIILYL